MENARKLVLTLVIVAVTLIIAVFITATMSTTFRVSTSDSITNDTITLVSEVPKAMGVSSYDRVSCGTISYVLNYSAIATTNLTSGNYTQTGCTIAFKGDQVEFNNSNWKLGYSYVWYNDTFTSKAADTAASAFNSGTSWLVIIIVVGFAVVVLALLNKINVGGHSGESEVYEMQEY